jgi:1-acyl-sn-glycerol-3-phosphate acyltransferase
MLSGILCKIFCWLYLKVEIIGRENIPKQHRGILFSSNHQSLIDSWFIACFLMPFFYLIFHPGILPWNAADRKNFFNTPIKRFIFSHLRCFPVSRNTVGTAGAREFANAGQQILAAGNLLVFFEGTRTRNGSIGKAKFGVGQIIFENKPLVIPIRIEGLNKIMPIGCKWYYFFLPFRKTKKITIRYGKPLEFADLFNQTPSTNLYQQIADKIKHAVEQL